MAPGLDHSLDQRGETAIVRLVGELDRVIAPELTAVLERAAESASRLVVDLREISFMDVGGLQVILEAQAVASGADHDLDLVPGPPAVQRVFELTDTEARLRFVPPPEDSRQWPPQWSRRQG